jgi:hypothetical protein
MADKKPSDDSLETMVDTIRNAGFRDRIIVKTPARKGLAEQAIKRMAPEKELVVVVVEDRHDEDDFVLA